MRRPYPRFLAARLREALDDTPAVLIHGPRQSGKTTLARSVGDRRGYRYLSFDQDVLRDAARQDPTGFVEDLPHRVILDEVQRVPEIFTALKLAIDTRRVPGRFILTGSANLLLLPALADSLAGRIGLLRLHPLSQAEIARREPAFLDQLFGTGFSITQSARLGPALADLIVHGGYAAALNLKTRTRRSAWYRDYIETQIQRDVRDMSRIRSLDALPRLLKLAAANTAQLVNFADLAGPFQLTRQTIHDYVTVLERIFLLEQLPPWHSNRLSRLVKTPKLHVGDTGVACALLGLDASALREDRSMYGRMLETFVLQELRRQASWRTDELRFHHFRDRDGVEIDIVIEGAGGAIAGIEVKSAASVNASDFAGMRKLKEVAGPRFARGVVLYDGDVSVSFAERLHAVPIAQLWRPRARANRDY